MPRLLTTEHIRLRWSVASRRPRSNSKESGMGHQQPVYATPDTAVLRQMLLALVAAHWPTRILPDRLRT